MRGYRRRTSQVISPAVLALSWRAALALPVSRGRSGPFAIGFIITLAPLRRPALAATHHKEHQETRQEKQEEDPPGPPG